VDSLATLANKHGNAMPTIARMTGRLTNLPGVARTNSHFTMKTIKDAGLPGALT
jgi:hypothetical protein